MCHSTHWVLQSSLSFLTAWDSLSLSRMLSKKTLTFWRRVKKLRVRWLCKSRSLLLGFGMMKQQRDSTRGCCNGHIMQHGSSIRIRIWLAIIKSANYKRSRKTLNRLLIKKLNRRGSNTFFEKRRKTANEWRAIEEPLTRIRDKQTSFICGRVDSNNGRSVTSFC